MFLTKLKSYIFFSQPNRLAKKNLTHNHAQHNTEDSTTTFRPHRTPKHRSHPHSIPQTWHKWQTRSLLVRDRFHKPYPSCNLSHTPHTPQVSSSTDQGCWPQLQISNSYTLIEFPHWIPGDIRGSEAWGGGGS